MVRKWFRTPLLACVACIALLNSHQPASSSDPLACGPRLGSPTLEIQAAAAELLLKVAENPLLDPQTRAEAVRQIGLQRNRQAVPRLIRLLPGQYNVFTREVIIALGEIGDSRALPALRNVVDDAETDGIDFPPGIASALAGAYDQILEQQRSSKKKK